MTTWTPGVAPKRSVACVQNAGIVPTTNGNFKTLQLPGVRILPLGVWYRMDYQRAWGGGITVSGG